ncbi:MAG: hypothetical protein RL189_1926 [Pseudomonadota bacterium]|jgi:hypothetical protein
MTNDTRMISGVDIFVEAPFSAGLPAQIGTLKLAHISSRGTKLKGSELEKTILDVGWLCARYVFDAPVKHGTEADAAICQVVQKVGSQYKWSSLIKLYSQDGKPQFS